MTELTQRDEEAARRAMADRRHQPTRMLSRYTVVGRRRRNRRGTDPQIAYYVDWVEGTYLRVLMGILILIAVDTFSTLYIISQGGAEANPLMAWMLGRGPLWFIFAKLGSAVVAFLLLAVHRFFPVARALTSLLLGAYGALVFYHVYLLFRIHS